MMDKKRKEAILLESAKKLMRRFERLEGTQGFVRAHFDITTGDVSTGDVMAFLNYHPIKYVAQRNSAGAPWVIQSVEFEGDSASDEVRELVRKEIIDVFNTLEREKVERTAQKYKQVANLVKEKHRLVLKGLDCVLCVDSINGVHHAGPERVSVLKEKATLGGSLASDISLEEGSFSDPEAVFLAKTEGSFLFKKVHWLVDAADKARLKIAVQRNEQALEGSVILQSGDVIEVTKKMQDWTNCKRILVVKA